MQLPLISIIVAVYNGEAFLEDMIQSVIKQKYNNFELILIDGDSNDKSVNIIKKYEKNITFWISETDKGIYDAWNKGINRATGDWIMFLGCDDILLPNALDKYASFISNIPKDVDYVSSRMKIFDKKMKFIRVKGWCWEWPRFLKDMTVAHPGSLHSRKLFEKYGKFDITYKIVGDYEFLLRPGSDLKAAFFNEITVIMREGGASDSWLAIKEQYLATIRTGKYPMMFAIFNMYFIGCKYYTKNFLRALNINAYLRK